MIDFKTLGDVPVVDEILNTDTVLVARDGKIYRADKSKVGGGAGGYLLVPGEGEVVFDSSQMVIFISTPIDDLGAAVKSGGSVTIDLDLEAVLGDEGAGMSMYANLLFYCDSAAMLEAASASYGATLAAIAGILFESEFMSVAFTNGGPLPEVTDNASVTSLTADGSTSPLAALRAKLGGGSK